MITAFGQKLHLTACPISPGRLYLTARLPTTPLVSPEIEDVVQEDVGEERADARALRRSPRRFIRLNRVKEAADNRKAANPSAGVAAKVILSLKLPIWNST